MSETMIQADNLVKIYKTTDIEVMALQGLDMTVETGELMAIIGNSGSGKSTFLNMIGGLDRPSAGRLFVDGKNLFTMSDKELVEYKKNTVGFVWQNNARNLLPYLSAYQNIMTPMLFSNVIKDKKERIQELLELVGMEKRKNHRLSQLSGGEQQRIAIAIALANRPKLLLADEPTGSVDRKTADYILDVFRKLNQESGLTIVIVTHDMELAKKVSRVATIRDGKISSELIMKEKYIFQDDDAITWDDKETEEETQEEYAIMDRSGRVQIPRQYLDDLNISGNRLKIRHEDKTIVLTKE